MKTAPDPKEVQEFLFKQSTTYQICDGFISVPTPCSLVVPDRKRGILYIGHGKSITVLKPKEDVNPEWKVQIDLQTTVSIIALSCDCTYLAVASNGPVVLIYNAHSFARNSPQLLHELRASTSSADAYIRDLKWNPSIAGMLCTISSDHTIGSFHIKDEKERTVGVNALECPDGLDACCAAWSPKGKQIVVGCKNGNIVQLKPDLKAARTIPGPEPYMGEVITVLWISNYQFCAAYLGTEQRVNVLIVDAPKGDSNAIFTCYEDITYGMPEGDVGVPRYYFEYIPEWSVIVAASSVSSEIAVLGSSDNGSTWSQWQLIDSGRAQLPLIRTTEVYPIGLAIDKSPINKLSWGADATLPNPVPVLHIFGTSGQLCSFHVVNLVPNCPAINIPPTEILSKPVEISFSINSVTTSTPKPKHVENLEERPKEPPITNIFGDSLKVAGFFRQQEPEKIKVPEPKSVPVNVEVSNAAVKKVVPETAKVEVKLTETKQEVERKTNVDESICVRAYFEEINTFEKELRSRLEPQSWECGTAEERKQLGERASLIDQFLRDLKETTNSLSSDIAYLKALLLQSFAWVEETKSKNAASADFNSRPYCDGNKISDLLQLYCYTQAQLDQATKILDLEWSEQKFQETSRMRIPSLEFVYQNLVLHSKIISKERARMESLRKRWTSLSRSNSVIALSRSMSNMHVASPKSCRRENSGIIEARCKTVAWKTLSFTQTKMLKLKGLLCESTPKVVRPANPSPIQDRLEATLSSLAHQSAMAEEKIGKSEIVAKHNLVNKKTNEKVKGQSPLASLNSIVASIGSPELGEQKAQVKSSSSNITFPAKLSQVEKKSSSPASSTTARAKQKQEPIFGQANSTSQGFPGLQQSFPKMDSISFGTSTPKVQENSSQKPRLKENLDKISKNTGNGEIFKVDTPAFSSKEDFLSSKTQLVKQNVSPPVTTVAKSDISTTFTFTTPGVTMTSAKNNLREGAQTFSFASKSPNSFSFALKTPATAPQSQTQGSLSLGGLCLGFQGSTEQQIRPNTQNSEAKSSDKESKSPVLDFQQSLTTDLVQKVSNMGGVSISVVNGVSGATNTSSDEANVPTFEKSVQPVASGSIFGNQTGVLTASVFGGTSMNTATVAASAATTPAQVSSASVPVFSGFPTSTLTLTSTTTTSFQTISSKPTYPEQPATFSVPSNDSPSVSFGSVLPTENSVPSVFDKPAASPLSTSNGFPSSSAASSTTNTFDKPILSSSTPFAGPSSGSIFGGGTASFSTNIFGSSTPSSSIFGGNSGTMGTFGATSPASPFDGAQKPSSIFGGGATTGGSFFGGGTAAVPVSESVFSAPATGLSPMGVGSTSSVFGQAATFGAKPVFGSPPSMFGSQVFGSGFGTTAFGGAAAGTTGFGASPPLASGPPMKSPMPGVFGESSGSTTFETLGSQSGGLTFGSLAQKSPEPDKPVFAGGSSFSSWR